jgi:hypothetical protein
MKLLPAVSKSQSVREPARAVPVAADVDICVIGGSCTGVFAAVAAARRGARVAIVENHGFFGGMATAALIGVWHSTLDTEFRQTIIAGLTAEVIARLQRRDAVLRMKNNPHKAYILSTPELQIELDRIIGEAQVRPFLHARFVAPLVQSGRLAAAVIEDKSGRRAIRARYFVDASGDGDLIVRLGIPCRRLRDLQPPTTAAVLRGLDTLSKKNRTFSLGRTVFDPALPGSLPPGFLWDAGVVGQPECRLVVGTRVSGADCSDADQLTRAEIEGRRQVRAMVDLLHDLVPGGRAVTLAALPAHIGVRETRHANCLHRLTEKEVLSGRRFPDAIANGSYRVDVHHSGKPGITFRYLNGREVYIESNGACQEGRWRPETATNPLFYQIPYRSLVPRGPLTANVLVAGRLMDADRGAYGAVRVIVNCNQTGEAAGTAAFLALDGGLPVAKVNPTALRRSLAAGGAAVM